MAWILSKTWKPLLHLLKGNRVPPNSVTTDVPQHTPTSGPEKGRLPLQPTVHSHYPHPVPLTYWPAPLSNQTLPRINTGYFPAKLPFTTTYLWRWNRQSVPKRRLLIFRRRGNTQKIIYLKDLILCYFYLTKFSSVDAINLTIVSWNPSIIQDITWRYHFRLL
jgi:hypothetical protein